MKRLAASLALSMAFVLQAAASTLPSPAEMAKRLTAAPVVVTVIEPHIGEVRRSYEAYPARLVLDSVLGAGWNSPGAAVRFRALDGYASVIPAARLTGPDAYLAFALADGQPFTVDNVQQNEGNVALGPWYLVWDNIRTPALLKEGAAIWPYQVAEVEVAAAGDAWLFPQGLDARYRAGGELVRANCITCHKVNGYGGDKLAINLAEVGKTMPRETLVGWLMAPGSVKPGTTMPGLPAEWPDGERRQAAEAIAAYLAAVPVLPAP